MRRTLRWLAPVLATALLQAAPRQPGGVRSFPAESGGNVAVRLSLGDIVVLTWDKAEVLVRGAGSSTTRRGDLLEITDRGPSQRPISRLEVNVPIDSRLDLESGSGNIEIRGRLKGELRIRTAAGDVRFDDLEGTARVSSGGGYLEARSIKGDADLRTAGGEIQVGQVSGDLTVKSAGGEIRLRDVTGDLTAETAGGDIDVGVVGGEAYLRSSGGDLRIQKASGPLTMRTAGGDIALSGSANRTLARTAGGDIRLHRVSGSVEARTSGGDVSIGLDPQGSDGSTIVSRGGDLRLTVPSSSRVTIEAVVELRGRWEDGDHMIESDFPADSKELDRRQRRIHAVYHLNGGGTRIYLETVNSDIEIRRQR